ncbi:hypothetical protein ACFQYP_24575 [Nonomuraea antimicrobica]
MALDVKAPPTRPAAPARRTRPRTSRLRRDGLLLLLGVPGLLVIVLFHYVPMLGNVIAFKDYQPFLGIWEAPWVGLRNFLVLFNGDPLFLNALVNTLVISLVQIVFVFPVPIALALLLNSLAGSGSSGWPSRSCTCRTSCRGWSSSRSSSTCWATRGC